MMVAIFAILIDNASMTTKQLRLARHQAGLTQVSAAQRLSISQAYLSQLETGSRAVPAGLARRVVWVYGLRESKKQMLAAPETSKLSENQLEQMLVRLGYPGFPKRVGMAVPELSPAQLVLAILKRAKVDARLMEAVPWLLGEHSNLDWDWLVQECKLRNLQNRLGYLVQLAKELVAKNRAALQVLSEVQAELEQARLAVEGTLCQEEMTEAERKWLRLRRPPAAQHWNLLTNLTAEELFYASHLRSGRTVEVVS